MLSLILFLHGTTPIWLRSRTGPCLFKRYRSFYQHLFIRDRSGTSPVLNQRERICCFYKLRMCRMYEAVSKWRCSNQNEPVQVFTRYWSNLGPERFQNWTCFFAGLKIGPKPHHIGDTDSIPCEQKAYPDRFSDQKSHARVAQISKGLETCGYRTIHMSTALHVQSYRKIYRMVFT